jgi:hypothetical protein
VNDAGPRRGRRWWSDGSCRVVRVDGGSRRWSQERVGIPVLLVKHERACWRQGERCVLDSRGRCWSAVCRIRPDHKRYTTVSPRSLGRRSKRNTLFAGVDEDGEVAFALALL